MLLTRILIMLQTIAHLLAALILSRHRLEEPNEALLDLQQRAGLGNL